MSRTIILACKSSILLLFFFMNAFQFNCMAQNIRKADHIVIVILENHAYTEIIGSSSATYINGLISDSNTALFTQYYGIEHPSQPNYLDLFSGCNQGVSDDNVPTNIPFTTDNLARQLIDSGKTFVTYSEDLPSVGFNGASSGNYARKHNPAANWMGSGLNQISMNTNQPFTAFPSNYNLLPTVSYVIPNQNNDMHNGSDPTRVVTGDSWVRANLEAYRIWALSHNSFLIITFDEDDTKTGNRILTLFNGPMIKGGQYKDTLTHYSILRTIEDMYHLRYACNAKTTAPIINCWKSIPAAINSLELNKFSFSIFPNPASNEISIQFDNKQEAKQNFIRITNQLGEIAVESEINIRKPISLLGLRAGIYFVCIYNDEQQEVQKLIIE